VAKWCREKGVEENNPFRHAKCSLFEKACHIVMVDALTDDAISSGKAAMEFRGFESEVAALNTDKKYLVHLMLHEVACHVLRCTDQASRDRWAFDRFSRYAI
jgi:hypothetical protein